MNKDRLHEIMTDQREVFNLQKDLIDRDVDLNRYIKTGQVVIISGIRRCGKSSLLYLIREKMQLDDAHCCYFNFDDERIIPDPELPEQVVNLHIELYREQPVLFFDEVQNIPAWEKFVNRMHESGFKIFVTGSNARLLSSEISTSLTGRNMVLDLFPFSFAEFLRYRGTYPESLQPGTRQKALIKAEFNHYLENGGFRLVVKEDDIELISSYFRDILYRDIIARYRLSQVNEIRQLAIYFATNISRRFSYSTLQKVSGIKSTSTIKDYLGYYEQSYLYHFLKKFDYSVKKQVMNPKKVYAIDPAISNRLGFNFSTNRGRVLENLVFLELLRRGKEVYYHAGKGECDFLIKEGIHVTKAIQVTWSLDGLNRDRETGGLREAMKLHDLDGGLVITADEEGPVEEGGPDIKCIPFWKWALT